MKLEKITIQGEISDVQWSDSRTDFEIKTMDSEKGIAVSLPKNCPQIQNGMGIRYTSQKVVDGAWSRPLSYELYDSPTNENLLGTHKF